MLYFQIDNYNNPQYLSFATKAEAETYIKEHPDCVGTKIQVTDDWGVKEGIANTYPNIGTYEVQLQRRVLEKFKPSQIVPTLVRIPMRAGGGKSFQDIFGTKNSSRGSIQNKILLAFWKTRFKRDTELNKMPTAVASKYQSMDAMFDFIIGMLDNHYPTRPDDPTRTLPQDQFSMVSIKIDNKTYNFASTKYANVPNNVPVISNDYRCIKVQDREYMNDRKGPKIVTIKASKLILDVMSTCRCVIGQQATTYIAEEFQRRYEASLAKLLSGLELHIDDHFDYIYSREHCAKDFGSCMCDKGQHAFYKNIMPCSAAYLVDTNIKTKANIVARCILFHNVEKADAPGKKFNYAERQYSDQVLYKHILISKLIEAGQIDFYKTIGAGCSDVNNIQDVNGKHVSNTRLKIKAKRKLKRGDLRSYQDTFKFYEISTGEFSNYPPATTYRDMGNTHPTYDWDE